jgi:hypothetical protein
MITRGEAWGKSTTRSIDDVVIAGDIALAKSSPNQRLIVSGGDIAHSLGNPPTPPIGSDCIEVSIDAMRVFVTSKNGNIEATIASSSVIIGNWYRGRFVCVTNGGSVGARDLSPRAHPNDGVFDVMTLDSAMDLQQRVLARRKSRLGNHIPHSLISNSRARNAEYSRLSRTEELRIDGRRVKSWINVQIEILPDYWRLLV